MCWIDDNDADDSDMISSGILNLGFGSSSSNQRSLVVEDEMVSISTTIRKI